jgi:exonuclease SbcC
MIINRLKVKGFKVAGEEISIDFPDNGVIAIQGPNESGKSTLLQVIEYCLYGIKKGATPQEQKENIITWGKDQAILELEFTARGQRYLLRRTIGKHKHSAELIPLLNGKLDSSKMIKNITEIEKQIEQIIGMDRDSFSKLVFVKQKELDALKELSKQGREQLVNKIMGIEVFDKAKEKIKEDLKSINEELRSSSPELEVVKKNYETYIDEENRRKSIEINLLKLSEQLKEMSTKLDEKKKEYDLYEWLSKLNSLKSSLNIKKQLLDNLYQQKQDLDKKKSKLVIYEKIMDQYGPEVEKLTNYERNFKTFEDEIIRLKNELDSDKRELEELATKLGLSKQDFQRILVRLPKSKNIYLTGFIITLMFSGILFSLTPLSILLLLPSSLLFYKYMKIDKLLSSLGQLLNLNKSISLKKQKLNKLRLQLNDLIKQSGFLSSSQIRDKLNQIVIKLEQENIIGGIEGLKGLISDLKETIRATNEDTLLVQIKNHAMETKKLEDDIATLRKMCPNGASEDMPYNELLHTKAKKEYEDTNKEYTEISSLVSSNEATISEIDKRLSELKTDHDRYPSLEEKVRILDNKQKVLNRLLLEIDEISNELRNKVIPQARYIINQILPTMTNGRYSDFDITADLKFKVYSVEAGDYKEREIFSGGTQDQFLIALRLAFTQSILDSRMIADKYCLLMDECIASSDEFRRQSIFEVIKLMRESFSQILLVSHEDISGFVDYYLNLDRDKTGYTVIKYKSWKK